MLIAKHNMIIYKIHVEVDDVETRPVSLMICFYLPHSLQIVKLWISYHNKSTW